MLIENSICFNYIGGRLLTERGGEFQDTSIMSSAAAIAVAYDMQETSRASEWFVGRIVLMETVTEFQLNQNCESSD